ncbi:MAG: HlyD family efflux transporter periplasmic adaptor subunit [Clostridia bacterium]|nr:HlyD family efflux transporter periplasmic adaptor subunit [Clostridia bacterium]
MKKCWGLALAVMLMFSTPAFADTVFEGRIVPDEAVSMRAPFGGVLKRMDLRAGSVISVGDPVAEIATTRVMATEDGVVTGVFAEAGDSAEQTVLYLAPVSKFTISATISKAYSSPETKYVTIGETVYIRCTKDGSHKAIGKITAVDDSAYTVETVAGELYMEETVNIYRSKDYNSKTCIGSGKVSRTSVIPVSGTGSILRMRVEDGEEVERGQTLFETVEGDIDALAAMEATLRSTVSGIVAEVSVSGGQKVTKGDTLFTCYPNGTLIIEFDIPQDFLSDVKIGQAIQVYFDFEEQKTPIPGTVTDVSYVSESSEEGTPVYKGYVSFENTGDIREGMNVYVSIAEEANR